MQLENIKKKRQIFNVLNIITALLIIAVSGLSAYILANTENGFIAVLFGVVSCVFGVIVLVMGVFLPPKEKELHVSGRAMKILLFISFLGSGQMHSPHLMQEKRLHRAWYFAGMVVVGTIMIILHVFAAMVADACGYSAAGCIGVIVCWVVLIVNSAFWTYYDAIYTGFQEGCGVSPAEYGKKAIRGMGKAILILVVIFGIASIGAYFINKEQHPSSIDLGQIREDMQQIQEKVDKLESSGFGKHEEYESVSDAVLSLKKTYGDAKYYYILQYTEPNELNILSWTDESDQVCVDAFECREDGGVVRKHDFISDAITKADVAGKQDGIVE